MTETVRVELECGGCGSKQFEYPKEAGPADIVTCKGCGSQGTLGELQRQAREKGMKAMTDIFRNLFKGK